jgi:2-dehydropantoate 2-reductase
MKSITHRSNHNQILIRGTGALACLFAARFAAKGITVNMLGTWAEGIEALSKRGVTIIDTKGNESNYPVFASNNPKDFPDKKTTLVLVKSYQTSIAANQLKDCLSEEGIALTLQNGLGNREKLARILGGDRVAIGVTSIGATLLKPGYVKEGGKGIIIIPQMKKLQNITILFNEAGFEVKHDENTNSIIWRKLIINSAINPITAILKVKNGELLKLETIRELLISTIQEGNTVSKSLNIDLSYADLIDTLMTTLELTANNRSSMLQDLDRGTQTEIDAISGEIAKIGDQYNIPTPINQTLWHLIKAEESKLHNQ